MTFEPTHLLNFEKGLSKRRKPWLTPGGEWPEITNAKFSNGRIVKRKGYESFCANLNALPIMGIFSYTTLAGVEYLIACDTRQVFRWTAPAPPAAGLFENAQTPVVDWTGGDSDFFHFCQFENFVVMNNGVDPPQKYIASTTTLSVLGTDFDADTTNNITAAWFCFKHNNRLVYLRTEEGGVDYAQRARWTPVNDVEYAAATGDEEDYFVDAPTSDRIIAADVIGGALVVVFDKSVWRLDYIGGSPYEAFKWVHLPAVEGTASRRGIVSLGGALLYRGHEGIKATDGMSVMAADRELPDDVLTWNTEKEQYSYGIRVPAEHEAILTYADQGDSYADRALVAHLGPDNRILGYSKYDLPLHCYGEYRQGATRSWDVAVAGYTPNEMPWSVDSMGNAIGAPIVLAGDLLGDIYEYGQGYSDAGAAVTMSLRSGLFNPYKAVMCHLGYIEIMADVIDGGSIDMHLYQDFRNAPYRTISFDISAAVESSSVVRRVVINRAANYHSFKIEVTSTGAIAIDRITIYTKPRGRMREIAIETVPAGAYGGFPYTFPFALG